MKMEIGTNIPSIRGMHDGFQDIKVQANEIAKAGNATINVGENTVNISNVAKSLLAMEQGAQQVTASAKTAEAFKQTVGSIIDMQA